MNRAAWVRNPSRLSGRCGACTAGAARIAGAAPRWRLACTCTHRTSCLSGGEPADVRQLPPAAGAAALRSGAGAGRARRAAALPRRPARPLGRSGHPGRRGRRTRRGTAARRPPPNSGSTATTRPPYASEAWRVAVDTGLVEIVDEEEGTVTAGEDLALRHLRRTAGRPRACGWARWTRCSPTRACPTSTISSAPWSEGGEIDFSALDWDPEAEAEFLDGVLGNLYLLTVGEDGPGDGPVPLPALAASMIVPDDMGEPTNDVLEQVSDAMMRLDDQFRLLEPIGLVDFQPVDEALMAERRRGARGPRGLRRHGRLAVRDGAADPARAVRDPGAAPRSRVRRARGRRPGRQGGRRAARRHLRLPAGRGAGRDRAVARPA